MGATKLRPSAGTKVAEANVGFCHELDGATQGDWHGTGEAATSFTYEWYRPVATSGADGTGPGAGQSGGGELGHVDSSRGGLGGCSPRDNSIVYRQVAVLNTQ